jgi:hypothetical protein
LNKIKKRKTKNESNNSYETLEPRQLLAIDFGVGSNLVDVTSSGFGGAPDLTGAVGPNHIVQVTDGNFRVFDKATGDPLVNKDLDAFWTDTGRGDDVGAEADPRMVNQTKNSRVLYDFDTRRWFIVSSSQNIDLITGTGAEGTQVPVLLAVSRSSDPTLDWQSLADTYDDDNDIVNGEGMPPTPPVRIDGGFLPDRTRTNNPNGWSLNMSLDDNSLFVTVDGAVTKTYVFNKFSLLVVPTPNSGAFFPNAIPGFDSTGSEQWNYEAKGVVAGTFGLETNAGGNSILLRELTGTNGTHSWSQGADVSIPVDPYEVPPIFIRQEFDPDIVNSSNSQIAPPVRLGNSLWAVHTIKGSVDVQNPDGGTVENSALRWYEIDLDTKTIKQSGTIEDTEFRNYIYPSIAVTEKGHVVIGFTSTGVTSQPGLGQFPSVAVAVGYDINGVMTFEDPYVIKDGDGGYLDAIGNFWGSYNSTMADPFDSDKVWVFGQWASGANTTNNGRNQITEIELIGHSPTISGDINDNVIIVRRSALDNAQIEVEIDGTVVSTIEEINLWEINLDGGGGLDTFIIDTSNGEFDFPNGVNVNGDGDDQIIFDTDAQTNFEVFVDGSGTASVGADVLAECEDHEAIAQQFILNFEEGSGWFDATPYNMNGYATRGDALRGELQKYFDEQIIPVFSNSFSIELDINDDAIDTLASARALGVGLDDINGQDLLVGSPWSILVGRGDRNADASDGVIDFNLDVALYQDDFEALLQNVAGGLTRSQFFKILGMTSEIPNETRTFDPRGSRNFATLLDVGYRDLNDNPLIGNYDAADSMFDVLNYQTNAIWAGDNTGIYFMGVDDSGNPMQLAVNSNSELIDFDTLASALAGTSRAGDFNDIIEQDRAFLRGLGIPLNPVVPVALQPGEPVRFVGVDRIQAGTGEDFFCIRSSNVDLEIRGGVGNDTFNVTGLGVGALNLFGEDGDDTYQVVFSPAGVITISDSLDSENDTLIGLGTANIDNFVFDVNGIKVNGGLLVYAGIENTSFDGLEGDDIFEVREAYPGVAGLNGGAGIDTFVVNSSGLGDTLRISVDDPGVEPVDRLRLAVSSAVTDMYTADEVENFMVDGLFVVDGTNGTPTVAGGINLLGDGDETFRLDSTLDAAWLIDGDGAGTLTMDTTDPITFSGLDLIEGGIGIDDVNITQTDTDLAFNARSGFDVFLINNAGVGALTINGSFGKDDFTVINSGSTTLDISGDSNDDTFTFNDSGTAVTTLSGGAGVDVFDVTNSGTVGLTIDAGERDDVINIDNEMGSAPIVVSAGDGNDVFNVISSGTGQIDLMGEVGDDTYVVTFVDPAATFNITDSINAENDRLVAFGSDGDDVYDIADGSNGLNWTVIGVENFIYDGGLGNDTFNVNTEPDFTGTISLMGGDGDDVFVVTQSGMGDVTLDGGIGDDSYTVHFQPNTDVTIIDSVGSEADSFFGFGTDGEDLLTLVVDMANVNGGIVNMTGIESVEYDALGAIDTYEVADAIGDSSFLGGSENDIFNVAQTVDGNTYMGNDGDDVFNIATSGGLVSFFGNAGNDLFNVTTTTGQGSYFGGDDDDTFDIREATGVSSFFGEAGLDQFIVTNHLPLGSDGSIDIDGGADRNQITVNGYPSQTNMAVVTSTQISGMSAVPINYAASGSFSVANDFGGIKLIGSDTNNDAFNVNTLLAKHTLDILGGGGNDRFTVSLGALGAVSADGQEGSDIYQYAIGSQNNRFLFALDSGVAGSDRIVATLSQGDDDLNLSGESFSVQTDSFGFNENFESLVVNARGGNDTIDINRLSVGFMRILTGAGDDQINVNNFTGVDSIVIHGGTGNDDILVNAGTVEGALAAYGGDGDDSFLISQRSYGNAVIDGQEGSDRYDVFIADRSSRIVVARDSGTIGEDHLSVFGTVLDDTLTFRSGVVRTPNQDILYSQSTESMSLLTEGSNDNITVFGLSSPVTNIMGQAGNDLIFVNSTFGPAPTKVLNINAGAGDDNVLVRGTNADTTTNVFGDAGNDNLNMGSSLASNNGNLNNLFGAVFASGGEGNDRVYINDVGKTASFNYDIGPSFVRNGGSPSNFFGGITYDDSVELLRLDATNFKNEVVVTPSLDTAFSIFGNTGFNSISLTGDPAVDGRQFFGENGGNGVWKFGNGAKDVFFSNFLLG